jgi:hypothetical protein
MLRPSIRLCLLGLLGAMAVLQVAPAHAQATRTWVSGVGDDANPCSRTAPCKTFAGAISKTAAGGEIDALDPGGFGTLTITNSITLDGGGGQVASVLASATAGINISASQANDFVILRNLRFDGLLGNGTGTAGTPGTNGINIVSAARVVIEKCEIFGFATAGIFINPSSGSTQVKVQETSLYNNHRGIWSQPKSGATLNLSIVRTQADNNTGGGMLIDGSGSGGSTSNASIFNSSASLNGGNGINAQSGPGSVAVDIMQTIVANNAANGVVSNNSAGSTATVTVGNSLLSNNTTAAWSNPSGTATLLSFKNNQVTGPIGSTPGTASFQ